MTTEATTPLDHVGAEEFLAFLVDPAKRADPYPFFSQLRALSPLHQVMDIWLASGYEVVSEVLRDGRFSTDERHSKMNVSADDFVQSEFGRLYYSMLLFNDDPVHKRLRDLVQKGFTRRVVENLRERIELLVDELVTNVLEREHVDLLEELAYPLPIVVICELLGVPPDDRHAFHDHAQDFAARFEIQPLRTPESEARGEAATCYFMDYLDGLIARKRAAPGDDLISSLAAVEEDGDRLTHDEMLATCLLILFAGHETTANLIGNGTLALLRNRDQWERLVAQPELARPAVEELLRYDTPVQIILRVAMDDIAMADRKLEAGDPIGLLLGSANRDDAHFPDPDRLDITREQAPIVAFGSGIHFCLGAPLARLEARIAFETLARRVPGLRLDADDVRWRPSFVIRGLEALPVATA